MWGGGRTIGGTRCTGWFCCGWPWLTSAQFRKANTLEVSRERRIYTLGCRVVSFPVRLINQIAVEIWLQVSNEAEKLSKFLCPLSVVSIAILSASLSCLTQNDYPRSLLLLWKGGPFFLDVLNVGYWR